MHTQTHITQCTIYSRHSISFGGCMLGSGLLALIALSCSWIYRQYYVYHIYISHKNWRNNMRIVSNVRSLYEYLCGVWFKKKIIFKLLSIKSVVDLLQFDQYVLCIYATSIQHFYVNHSFSEKRPKLTIIVCKNASEKKKRIRNTATEVERIRMKA